MGEIERGRGEERIQTVPWDPRALFDNHGLASVEDNIEYMYKNLGSASLMLSTTVTLRA